jgi:preprotein translocase subunit YajC
VIILLLIIAALLVYFLWWRPKQNKRPKHRLSTMDSGNAADDPRF